MPSHSMSSSASFPSPGGASSSQPPPVVPLSPSFPSIPSPSSSLSNAFSHLSPSSSSLSPLVLHRPIAVPLSRLGSLSGSSGIGISIPSHNSAFTSTASAFNAPSSSPSLLSSSLPSTSASSAFTASAPTVVRVSSLSSPPPASPAHPPPLNTHSSLGSPPSGPAASPLSASDITPNSHNHPPSSARLSSTSSSFSESAASISSPSFAGSSSSTTASSPPSISRVHRHSSSSLAPSSHHRSDSSGITVLSNDASTSDLSSLGGGSPSISARRTGDAVTPSKPDDAAMFDRTFSEEGAVDDDEEDDDDEVVMDDGEAPTPAMLEEVGPAAAGLTASQLAAVHKGTSCHQCFPALQTRVLTDTGFLFLDEIERRIKAGQRVLYACYAPDSREPQRKCEDAMKGQLVYRDGDLVYPPAPTSLIELNSTHARKRWAEGSGAYGLGLRTVVATVNADVDTEMEDRDADDDDEDEEDDQEEEDQQEEGKAKPRRRQYSHHVSLLVTPDHDLYAQMGSVSGGGVTFVPQRVVEVVGGKQRLFVLPPSKVRASQLLGAPHERASVRLLAAASSGHTPSPAAAGQVTAVKARLGLTSDAQFDTFLELLGFWLGDGTLSYKRGGAVRFSQVKEGDISFLDETLLKVGQRLQDVVRTESQLRRPDGTVKTRVTWDIRDRRWFDFFDQEFGLKYKESQYYERDAAVARQGNGRPASAEQPSTPATVTRSVASSTATPSRSSTRSSIDMTDLTASYDEEVKVATPTRTRAVSSPLASALPFVRRSARRNSVPERYGVYASDAEAAKAKQEAEWLYGEPVKMENDPPIKEEDDPPIKEEDEPPLKEEEPPVVEPSDPKEEEPPEDDCDDSIKLVKWLPEWVVMHLSSRQLRLVIHGIYRADGSFECGYNQIWTSGAAFRDQLMQALLHCGYTAMPLLQYPAGAVRAYRWHDQTVDSTVFTLKQYAAVKPEHRHLYREVRANADSWYVCWSEAVSTGKAVCWPNIRRQEGMEEVPYSVTEHGRIWCVTVHHPDHLIVAQRALRHPGTGVVCKQSRPIIVGQCKNTKQLKKLAFCANLFNKRTKPEKRVCRKKYCETSDDSQPRLHTAQHLPPLPHLSHSPSHLRCPAAGSPACADASARRTRACSPRMGCCSWTRSRGG